MTERTHELILIQTATLLQRYGFELRGYTARVLIEQWVKCYSASWIRLAVVEALYQGRYKAISVEHILSLWLRRGQANFHFTHEFDRLICRNLPHYFPSPFKAEDLKENHTPLNLTETEIADSLTEWNERLTDKESRFSLAPLESLKTSEKPVNSQEILANPELDNIVPEREEATPSLENSLSPIVLENNAPLTFIDVSERSIHQFTPLLDHSELYVKLRSVINKQLSVSSKISVADVSSF